MVYMDGGYRGSETRTTNSETYELTGYESADSAQQDSPATESMSSEWTDEKHNLYLKSMEVSFVNQLYNSVDLLGWRSQKEAAVPNLSGEVNCSTCSPSSQFKVLQHGCWQKITFRRPESQISPIKESPSFLTTPWIQHFRSARKPEGGASPSLQDHVIQSRAFNLNGKQGILCRSATSTKHSQSQNSFSCRHDLVDSNTVAEMSDQNFVDEDIKGEKASSSCSSKRMKTLTTNHASSNDQVVPRGKPPVAEPTAEEECISAAK